MKEIPASALEHVIPMENADKGVPFYNRSGQRIGVHEFARLCDIHDYKWLATTELWWPDSDRSKQRDAVVMTIWTGFDIELNFASEPDYKPFIYETTAFTEVPHRVPDTDQLASRTEEGAMAAHYFVCMQVYAKGYRP